MLVFFLEAEFSGQTHRVAVYAGAGKATRARVRENVGVRPLAVADNRGEELQARSDRQARELPRDSLGALREHLAPALRAVRRADVGV